jgi:hypothetical protein
MFGIDNNILVIGIIIAGIICIAVVSAIIKIRRRAKGYPGNINLDPSRTPLRVQKIPAYSSADNSSDQDTVIGSASRKNEGDCLKGRANISESLLALAEKFALDEITLATCDGLLLASSLKLPSADAAARYSKMFAENVRPLPPGVLLFGIEHKGSILVGIAKTRDLLAQEPDQDLLSETKDILNWWI